VAGGGGSTPIRLIVYVTDRVTGRKSFGFNRLREKAVYSIAPPPLYGATPNMEIAIALIVGFALGYGVREWISRRRRQAERRRRSL
jgi:hypothetical protein